MFSTNKDPTYSSSGVDVVDLDSDVAVQGSWGLSGVGVDASIGVTATGSNSWDDWPTSVGESELSTDGRWVTGVEGG